MLGSFKPTSARSKRDGANKSHERLARALELLRELAPAGLTSLGVFLLVGWFNGRRMIFNADRDEGYALIQALLVRRGHPLYTETWSDQPPGYTWMLAAWTRLFGESPELARLTTALFLAAFAFMCFELSRRAFKGVAGFVGGAACVAALLLQNEMFYFGAAAMVSLPALLCMGLSWAVSARCSSRFTGSVAGVVMGFALAIKPLGAPAVPGILAGLCIWTFLRTRSARQSFEALAVMMAAALLTAALFGWPVFLRDGGYTVYQTHHVRAGGWPGLDALEGFYRADRWLFGAAAIGWGVLVARRRVEAVPLGLWIVLGGVALARYEPIWNHHRYLLLIPAAALGGLGLGAALELALQKKSWLRYTGAVCVLAICVLVVVAFPTSRFKQVKQAFNTKASPEHVVVQRVRQSVPDARRMVTSRQMYAYRLELDVPPSQAVTSRKRFQRWKLSSQELAATSLQFDPDVVALDDRWPASAVRKIRHALRESHVVLHQKGREIVLARKTMVSPGSQRERGVASSQKW